MSSIKKNISKFESAENFPWENLFSEDNEKYISGLSKIEKYFKADLLRLVVRILEIKDVTGTKDENMQKIKKETTIIRNKINKIKDDSDKEKMRVDLINYYKALLITKEDKNANVSIPKRPMLLPLTESELNRINEQFPGVVSSEVKKERRTSVTKELLSKDITQLGKINDEKMLLMLVMYFYDLLRKEGKTGLKAGEFKNFIIENVTNRMSENSIVFNYDKQKETLIKFQNLMKEKKITRDDNKEAILTITALLSTPVVILDSDKPLIGEVKIEIDEKKGKDIGNIPDIVDVEDVDVPSRKIETVKIKKSGKSVEEFKKYILSKGWKLPKDESKEGLCDYTLEKIKEEDKAIKSVETKLEKELESIKGIMENMLIEQEKRISRLEKLKKSKTTVDIKEDIKKLEKEVKTTDIKLEKLDTEIKEQEKIQKEIIKEKEINKEVCYKMKDMIKTGKFDMVDLLNDLKCKSGVCDLNKSMCTNESSSLNMRKVEGVEVIADEKEVNEIRKGVTIKKNLDETKQIMEEMAVLMAKRNKAIEVLKSKGDIIIKKAEEIADSQPLLNINEEKQRINIVDKLNEYKQMIITMIDKYIPEKITDDFVDIIIKEIKEVDMRVYFSEVKMYVNDVFLELIKEVEDNKKKLLLEQPVREEEYIPENLEREMLSDFDLREAVYRLIDSNMESILEDIQRDKNNREWTVSTIKKNIIEEYYLPLDALKGKKQEIIKYWDEFLARKNYIDTATNNYINMYNKKGVKITPELKRDINYKVIREYENKINISYNKKEPVIEEQIEEVEPTPEDFTRIIGGVLDKIKSKRKEDIEREVVVELKKQLNRDYSEEVDSIREWINYVVNLRESDVEEIDIKEDENYSKEEAEKVYNLLYDTVDNVYKKNNKTYLKLTDKLFNQIVGVVEKRKSYAMNELRKNEIKYMLTTIIDKLNESYSKTKSIEAPTIRKEVKKCNLKDSSMLSTNEELIENLRCDEGEVCDLDKNECVPVEEIKNDEIVESITIGDSIMKVKGKNAIVDALKNKILNINKMKEEEPKIQFVSQKSSLEDIRSSMSSMIKGANINENRVRMEQREAREKISNLIKKYKDQL